MVSRIMQKEGSEELADDLDRHTKLFLSFAGRLDKKMRSKSRRGEEEETDDKIKLIWLKRPNLLNLLSLPDMMRKFGSLHDLWEGSAKVKGSFGG